MENEVESNQFLITDEQLVDLGQKLLLFGHQNHLKTHELAIVLKLTSEWIAEQIGLEIKDIVEGEAKGLQ